MSNERLDSVPAPQQSPWQVLGAIVAIAAVSCTFIVLAILLRPQLDAYTRSVLRLEGDATKGRSIFVMNCVACHGQWADGRVGPSLRGISDRLSKSQLIHQVVSGETPPMPQFQPESQDMADLLSYLKRL